MWATLANGIGQRCLAIAELVDQLLIANRLFERIEVGALDVFDDCELQCFLVAGFVDRDGNLVELRPAALRANGARRR